MSDTPPKPTKLIVTMAWDANDEGDMTVAYEAEQQSEERAISGQSYGLPPKVGLGHHPQA